MDLLPTDKLIWTMYFKAFVIVNITSLEPREINKVTLGKLSKLRSGETFDQVPIFRWYPRMIYNDSFSSYKDPGPIYKKKNCCNKHGQIYIISLILTDLVLIFFIFN